MTADNSIAKTAVAIFFVLLTLIGLFTVGDYNGSYDELAEMGILASNLKEYALRLQEIGIDWQYWLQSGAEPISQSVERDHGICGYYLYGMLLPLFEGNEGLRFTLWSVLTWLWFMLGCWSLYAIARKMGMNRMLACAAVLMVYLSPRFFADAHLNNKDMVVFSLMLATLWLGACFAQRPSLFRGILFSIVGAMAMNTKIVAAIAWGLMYAGAFCKLILDGKLQRKNCFVFAATAVGFLSCYLLVTPAAWDAPLELFSYLIQNAAAFSRWSGTLYFRDASFRLPENPLPAYYLPYMILVTVPLYTLPLCAVGQMAALMEAVRSPKAFLSNTKGVLLTAATVVWFLPVAAFAVLRPIVYNGWRHFYFVFAGLAVLAGYGIQVLWNQKRSWIKKIFALCLTACFAVTAVGMTVNHPRQSSYYNVLSGGLAMETDYWTASGTYALEKLISSEERNQSLPLEVGCYFWDLQNARFKLSDEQKALLTTSVKRDSPYLYYNENYVQVYNVPDPEGYHVLFEVESYGRLIGTMYERDQ